MPVKVRHSAPGNNKRTSESGFNLDLTYIKPNIIAMGFPYENFEGIFKSRGIRMDEVVKFLDLRHLHHYRVYNLCSERSYDPSRFHMQVITYPFDAHCPPPFELIQQFCEDMSAYLKADNRNVAVVHCSDGVERTGVMICSYLIHDQIFCNTMDALQFFAAARTHNRVDVIMPSQCRYVQYYEYMLSKDLCFPNEVSLQSLMFVGNPCMRGGSHSPYFTISRQKVKTYASKIFDHVKKSSHTTEFLLPHQLPLCGDVTIEFFHHTRFGGKESMFTFSFNTYFVDMHLLLQQHQRRHTQTYRIHEQPVSTSSLASDSDDDSANEIERMSNGSQNSSFLSVHSQGSGIKNFRSLTDLHAAGNDMASITHERRSSSGSLSSLWSKSSKPAMSTESTFELLYKKNLPHDKQLRRALKKAGKQAGVDITTGFTTVVHKPVKPNDILRKVPKAARYNQNLTVKFNRRRSATYDGKIATNGTPDAIPISVSSDDSVTESSNRHVSVTIVLPLSELDHNTKDKKHFPNDFQLHMVLSVDARLIKDIDSGFSELSHTL